MAGGLDAAAQSAATRAPLDSEALPGADSQALKSPSNHNFAKYNISESTVNVLTRKKFTDLLPIQQASFKDIFEGRDVYGKEKTGSGKTIAFALPVIERFRQQGKFSGEGPKKVLKLVLAPTRELAH